MKPSRRGIALTLPVWQEAKEEMLKLLEIDHELLSAPRCGSGLLIHHSQLRKAHCKECTPFYHPVNPPVQPPAFRESDTEEEIPIDGVPNGVVVNVLDDDSAMAALIRAAEEAEEAEAARSG